MTSDLSSLLSDARRKVSDDRSIWLERSVHYESTVSLRKGLVLGGTLSPLFLQGSSSSASNTWVPWMLALYSPRLLVLRDATAPLSAWLPLLEDLAKNGQSFALAAETISMELLGMFYANCSRATLHACALRLNSKFDSLDPLLQEAAVLPTSAAKLPKLTAMWTRRTSSVIFPDTNDTASRALSDVAVISVGGNHYDEQTERLRFLMRALEPAE